MNTAFAILARLGMDATAFRADLKQTTKEFRGWIDNLAKLGAGLALGAFTKLAADAVKLGGALDATSKKLGLSTDLLQEFGFAAEQFGIGQDTANMALQRFSRRLAEAGQGAGELLPIIEQYNLQLKDSQGNARAAEAVLGDLAEVIRRTENPTERLRIAFKAFDSEGVGLVNVLADGRAGLKAWGEQARDSGAVLEAETVAALARAEDAILNFRKRATVAVGEIIVNFRTREGLELLNLQLMKVVSTFGARMIDAITYISRLTNNVLVAALGNVAGKFYDLMLDAITGIATQLNKILPDKLQINVGGIEGLKTAGVGIGQAITLAIANTKPDALTDTVEKLFDDAIEGQRMVVNELDKSEFVVTPAKIQIAGEEAGAAIAEGGKKAAEEIGTVVEKKVKPSMEQVAKSMGLELIGAGRAVAQSISGAFKGLTLPTELFDASGRQYSDPAQQAMFEQQRLDSATRDIDRTIAMLEEKIIAATQSQYRGSGADINALRQEITILRNRRANVADYVFDPSYSDARGLGRVGARAAQFEDPGAIGRLEEQAKAQNQNLTDIATRLRRLVPRA